MLYVVSLNIQPKPIYEIILINIYFAIANEITDRIKHNWTCMYLNVTTIILPIII